MKKISLLALFSALLLTGCGTAPGRVADRTLFTPTAWQTNTTPEHVVQVQTNRPVVIEAVAPDGTTTYTTNREPVTLAVTIPASQTIVPIAWEPNRATLAAVDTAGAFIPGYGALASTAATALLGLIAHLRSRRYREAAVSIATGVSHYLAQRPANAEGLVSVLKQVQDDDGTRSTVRGLLDKSVPIVPRVS